MRKIPELTPHATKRDHSVISHIIDPTHTHFGDEEFLYVPWDPDGRRYWLYLIVFHHDQMTKICRIRSNRADDYDDRQEEAVEGFSQIGNQLGYLATSQGPLFVRITFGRNPSGRNVPVLEYSLDGLHWSLASSSSGSMAGSADNHLNKNMFFLSIATVAGLGPIHQTGPDTFETLYGGCTCNSPVAPDIFNSDIGVGDIVLTVTPPSTRRAPAAIDQLAPRNNLIDGHDNVPTDEPSR